MLLDAARLTAVGVLGPHLAEAQARAPVAIATDALALPVRLADRDYWGFADWLQVDLERKWDPTSRTYGADARVNAMMLITHSLAALLGHDGATRQDERARLIAARLLQSPPYVPHVPARGYQLKQRHAPGFVVSMFDPRSDQHVAIDPEIAEGLVFAWRARVQLALDPALLAAIEQAVAAVASGPFYRYPNVRLNQCNWNGELYAYAAEVAGRTDLLVGDYRKQLERFLAGARHPTRPWSTTNLSPSYSFHRNPFAPVQDGENIESAEYANLVLGIVARYRAARAAGMPRPPAEHLRTLRAWIARALPAYWTHSGYLNWDTGVHPGRWNTGHYWAFALDGLAAVATAPSELCEPEQGEWAKHLFDRALATYVRLVSERDDGVRIPRSPLLTLTPDKEPASALFAVRFQSQATRAAYLGLGSARSRRPPPLYAFDPSIGRLAISTPHYNTAVVAVSNGAFAYGGIELARLFDGDQRVAAGVAPYGTEGFGVSIAHGENVLLSSQTPRRTAGPTPPLVLTRSPRGAVRAGVQYPTHPYAGPFERVGCEGKVVRDGLAVRTSHEFSADQIRTTWQVSRRDTDRHLRVTAGFPAWAPDAWIEAELHGGTTVAVGVRGIRAARVASFLVRCGEAQSGYRLRLLGAPAQALASVAVSGAQGSNPRPGRLLIVSLADGAGWRELSLTAEITPGVR